MYSFLGLIYSPAMASPLSLLAQSIRDSGYAYLPAYKSALTTMQVAKELGEVIAIQDIPTVQRIAPRERDNAPRNSYSGAYGFGDFPLHTDLAHWYIPPRYIIIRCIVPNSDVLTRLLQFHRCLREMPDDTLQRAQFIPRRSVGGRKYILRIYQEVDEHYLLRWDELFIVPANQEALKVKNHLSAAFSQNATEDFSLSQESDTLIIDNWRMLHGRSSVPGNGMGRVIERIYLKELK